MSSLRLALKLSMSEAPASALQSKGSKPSSTNEVDEADLDKSAQLKRKRKLSIGGAGDDSSVTDNVPSGPQKKGNEKEAGESLRFSIPMTFGTTTAASIVTYA
jgi:hypothetical protein